MGSLNYVFSQRPPNITSVNPPSEWKDSVDKNLERLFQLTVDRRKESTKFKICMEEILNQVNTLVVKAGTAAEGPGVVSIPGKPSSDAEILDLIKHATVVIDLDAVEDVGRNGGSLPPSASEDASTG
jgi:hypothetical protein